MVIGGDVYFLAKEPGGFPDRFPDHGRYRHRITDARHRNPSSNQGGIRGADPNHARPDAVWMFLESTYTPTPLVAFTAHPQFEAFQLAMTAYANNDWSAAVDYFQQVIDTQQDKTIPDILYYQAESYRNLGYTKPALDVYNRIIKSRPEFAPAYMGQGIDSADGFAQGLHHGDQRI